MTRRKLRLALFGQGIGMLRRSTLNLALRSLVEGKATVRGTGECEFRVWESPPGKRHIGFRLRSVRTSGLDAMSGGVPTDLPWRHARRERRG